MTVKELIEELIKMPQDKKVEAGSLSVTIGEVARVIEYDDFVELETNDN
jgi:hypothetical protein